MALPSSMVASVETHSGLGRRTVRNATLLAMYFCASFKQRIAMLYGMAVNSEDFGGRYGTDPWLVGKLRKQSQTQLPCV